MFIEIFRPLIQCIDVLSAARSCPLRADKGSCRSWLALPWGGINGSRSVNLRALGPIHVGSYEWTCVQDCFLLLFIYLFSH